MSHKSFIHQALSKLGIETQGRQVTATSLSAIAAIGQFPKALQQFEATYDHNTGGWSDSGSPTGISYGSIELEVGRALYGIVRLLQPSSILETGSHLGYSTCCLAQAMLDNASLRGQVPPAKGSITTLDPWVVPHLWDNTQLADLIEWLPRMSSDELPQVSSRMFDLLVLDSDHSYETIIGELISFEPLLSEGGVILMHDGLYFDGVGAALKQLYTNPRFETVTLTSPRRHEHKGVRPPGFSIVRKIRSGNPPLVFEQEFAGWNVGNRLDEPFVRKWLLDKSKEQQMG